MTIDLSKLHSEFDQELANISQWWSTKAWDEKNGSLYGEIDRLGQENTDANKGVILFVRTLWFYSVTAKYRGEPRLRELADRLYGYIDRHFVDHKNGGLFWELNAKGEVVTTRKQTFAQAFALYAYSAYYALTEKPEVLVKANALFVLIETKTTDIEIGGHLAAFSENWKALDNMAIDSNDVDAPKTLDTELHLLEAYTAFYKVAPSRRLADAIQEILRLFDSYFIDKQTFRFKTHLSEQWGDLSQVVIHGHIVECAWLIWDGVTAVEDDSEPLQYWRPIVLNLIERSLERYTTRHHSLFESSNLTTDETSTNSIWWMQAEALVAYMVAYDLSGQDKFAEAFERVWSWIKAHHIDNRNDEYGEWHAVINDSLEPEHIAKAFMWKGPYHNGRAMLKACQYLQGES